MYSFYSTDTDGFTGPWGPGVANIGGNSVQAYKDDASSTGSEAGMFMQAYVDAAGSAGLPAWAYADWGGSAEASWCATGYVNPPDSASYDPVAGEAYCESAFNVLIPDPNVIAWGLPEEMHVPTFNGNDYASIYADLTNWLHANDPMRRPTYVYIESDYGESDIVNYVPLADMMAPGAYRTDNGEAAFPAWIRWRIEQISTAMANAAGGPYSTGSGPNQRTPVLVTEAFGPDNGNSACPTPLDFIHDTYSGLASGAMAIFVYGYGQAYLCLANYGVDLFPAIESTTSNIL
jgi:hypothetical protein